MLVKVRSTSWKSVNAAAAPKDAGAGLRAR